MILDQTLLPNEVRYLSLTDARQLWDAIYLLQVRGAPAIGVTAALGMYMLALRSEATELDAFVRDFHEQKDYLNSSRPTAVNLSWALNRMEAALQRALQEWDMSHQNVNHTDEKAAAWRAFLADALKQEADTIYREDIEVCRRIGEHGLSLLKDGYGVLTHCNAGRLATVRYGTATAPLYLAHEQGMMLHVYCDETRPLLQGARLTAYELQAAGIDTTLICDNMSASIMQTGKIHAVFVGCDRVAANGDTANKIGTAVVAAVAKKYHVPFYVCAPTSTIDAATPTGAEIVIEQRKESEVTTMWYEKRMAPEGIHVYNPAFDVTSHEDITAIITEDGIVRPPYHFS